MSGLAVSYSTNPATRLHSYGYHRAEVLGALASVLVILNLTLVLVYGAICRVISPPGNLEPDFMLYTSIFGLVCNLIMFSVLHENGGGHGPGQSCGHDHGHASHHYEHLHEHDHDDEHHHHDEEKHGSGGNR